MNTTRSPRPPRWFVVIVIVMSLPILAFPWLWSCVVSQLPPYVNPDMMQLLLAALPFYIVATAWISCRIYPERPSVAWLLQVLQLLVYAALIWVCML